MTSMGYTAVLVVTLKSALAGLLATTAGLRGDAGAGLPSSASARHEAVPVATPKRLSLAEQWIRLTGVLSTAISGAQNAGQLQAAATQQLDLAQYALSTLMDELAAVMTVPGRREPASVHVLETASAARSVSQALAA